MCLAVEWGMYVNAEIGDPDLPQNAYAGQDYASYNIGNAAVRLTDPPDEGVALPRDANCALLVVENGSLRYRVGRVGSTEPEAGNGILMVEGEHKYENQRSFLEFVSFASEDLLSATRVTIMWGRTP